MGVFFFLQAEDGIRERLVTGVQTCALPSFKPVVLNQRQFALLGTGIAALVALFLGIFASNEWLTWLQYRNAVPFGQTDPLFGRDVSFYVFTLPFLDLARNLTLAVVVLSLIGPTAAYGVSGTQAPRGSGPYTGATVSSARGPFSILLGSPPCVPPNSGSAVGVPSFGAARASCPSGPSSSRM